MTNTTIRWTALTVGPLAALGVGWATSSVRDGLGIANVALLLAAITVLAAMLSWIAGLVTSTVAALTLNYFHTLPYRSLRVAERSDVLAVTLLATLGLLVSALTALRVRRTVAAGRIADTVLAGDEMVALSKRLHPIGEVWPTVASAMLGGLGSMTCRVVDRPDGSRSAVARKIDASPVADHTLVVPEAGASVALRTADGVRHLEIVPQPGLGAVAVDRRALLAFVDQLELSLQMAAGNKALEGASS